MFLQLKGPVAPNQMLFSAMYCVAQLSPALIPSSLLHISIQGYVRAGEGDEGAHAQVRDGHKALERGKGIKAA